MFVATFIIVFDSLVLCYLKENNMPFNNLTKLAEITRANKYRHNIFDSGDYDLQEMDRRREVEKRATQSKVGNTYNKIKSKLGFGSK